MRTQMEQPAEAEEATRGDAGTVERAGPGPDVFRSKEAVFKAPLAAEINLKVCYNARFDKFAHNWVQSSSSSNAPLGPGGLGATNTNLGKLWEGGLL